MSDELERYLPLNRSELIAENIKLRDKLLELAQSCTECGGTGVQTRFSFTEEERQQPCDDCADIRELLE